MDIILRYKGHSWVLNDLVKLVIVSFHSSLRLERKQVAYHFRCFHDIQVPDFEVSRLAVRKERCTSLFAVLDNEREVFIAWWPSLSQSVKSIRQETLSYIEDTKE